MAANGRDVGGLDVSGDVSLSGLYDLDLTLDRLRLEELQPYISDLTLLIKDQVYGDLMYIFHRYIKRPKETVLPTFLSKRLVPSSTFSLRFLIHFSLVDDLHFIKARGNGYVAMFWMSDRSTIC